VIVKKWLSDPQTTPMIGLPAPKSAALQWFNGYLVLCCSVVYVKGRLSGRGSRYLQIQSSAVNL
jgi:hypothetical protein